MLHFVNIASGSKGNSSIIYKEDTTIVVDFGITKKLAKSMFLKYFLDFDSVDAFLFTHDHTDHISNISSLPIEKCFSVEGIISEEQDILKKGQSICFGTIEVFVLRTYHDATNCCGFIFSDGETKIAYATDTGKLTKKEKKLIVNCDYYYLESNYDKFMLETSGRPWFLIARIDSDHGHLSNDQSARIASEVIGERTKLVALAHLSEECNTPQKAIETHELKWHKDHQNIKLITCKQREDTVIC